MGIPGLWKELESARTTRSLTHLAVVDGFEKNKGTRGFRIGIDASLWFFHAQMQQVREGENPELRMFFFRCCKLLAAPFLPLFVFDGPGRPTWKRGQRVGKKDGWMVPGAKNIIGAFGYEWRMAPGEAEAELAYLNRIGILDAVLTDDVDAFLFGAVTIIRNPSLTLTGNISKKEDLKNSAGKFDDNHAFVYKASALLERDDIKLTRGGLILIGLLNGGDYHEAGLVRCGLKIAHGLAKAGFGDSLFETASALPREEVEDFLVSWREEIRKELKTNSSGYLKTKQAKLSTQIPDTFPDMNVLMSYVKPITSERNPGMIPDPTWSREPDIGKLASVCELYFEWGVKEVIVHRFKTNIWPGIICRALRGGVMDKDAKSDSRRLPLFLPNVSDDDDEPSTPRKNRTAAVDPSTVPIPSTPSGIIARHFSSLAIGSPKKRRAKGIAVAESDEEEEETEEFPILTEISLTRTHASTDGILEYRVTYDPRSMVLAAEAGVRGIRPPLTVGFFSQVCAEAGSGGGTFAGDGADNEFGELADGDTVRKMKVQDKNALDKVWLPASMVDIVEGGLVKAYQDKKAAKGKKKTGTKTKKSKDKDLLLSDDEDDLPKKKKSAAKPRAAPKPKKKALSPPREEEEDEDDVFGGSPPSPSKKARTTPSRPSMVSVLDVEITSPGNITPALRQLQQQQKRKQNPKPASKAKSTQLSRQSPPVEINPFISSRPVVHDLSSDVEAESSRAAAQPNKHPKASASSKAVPSISPKKRSRSALERAMEAFSGDTKASDPVVPSGLSPTSWRAMLEESESDSDLINFSLFKRGQTISSNRNATAARPSANNPRSVPVRSSSHTGARPHGSKSTRVDNYVINISSDEDKSEGSINNNKPTLTTQRKPIRKVNEHHVHPTQPTADSEVIDLT